MKNKGDPGWAVLGVFFPIVGLILWFVWKDNKPKDAYMAIEGALVGAIVYIFAIIVFVVGSSCIHQVNYN